MKKFACALIALTLTVSASGQDRFADVTIETVNVAGNISVLYGAGGNIGVSAGEDGLLIIDDQFLPLAGRIKAALAKLGEDQPTWVLNTHYHGDHTGGNPAFGNDGIIVAHDNVRIRLVGGEENLPKSALPVVTYSEKASIHFNNEEIRLLHMPSGHTDGDTVVFFSDSGVVHMGDHFFRDRFPYVDLGAGGSVKGMTRNVAKILSMIDDDTRIIPGHGKLGGKADLERYHDMLTRTTAAVSKMVDNGLSIDDAVARGLDDKWESWGTGFINEERWIRTIHTELSD
ncbi:MAG: MBL fold metallo-hydrolase [Gammaproteobacteria bacterium]|nr:MBL fold metallo-hydrolase [Gammaproteobacteria bacterium]